MSQAETPVQNIFRSRYFELDVAGSNQLLLTTKYLHLARVVNRLTGKYPGYVFKLGEELMVRLNRQQFNELVPTLGLTPTQAAKIDSGFDAGHYG